MCMSCGCKMADENHGDERHITMDDLREAAEASGTSVDEVVRNIQETYREVGTAAGGQRYG